MIKIKKIFLNLILISFLHSCGAFSDAGKVLRNEKIKNRDEFSVQKKEPLSMPPEYDTLPRPGSVQKSKNNEDNNNIEKILKIKKENKSSNTSSSSVEDSVLNKIRK